MLTDLPSSVSRLSRQFVIVNISQTYTHPQSLLSRCWYCSEHCRANSRGVSRRAIGTLSCPSQPINNCNRMQCWQIRKSAVSRAIHCVCSNLYSAHDNATLLSGVPICVSHRGSAVWCCVVLCGAVWCFVAAGDRRHSFFVVFL
jgi:hypothetical protein